MERLTHEADFGLEDWEETLFFVPSDPNGSYNILDIAKQQGKPEFDKILIEISLRLAAIENILGDNYDMERLKTILSKCITLRQEVAEKMKLVGNVTVERLREIMEAERMRNHEV